MFIHSEDLNYRLEEGSLRERFLKEINESLSPVETFVSKEEILRKELFNQIRKGELEIPD